MLARLFRWLPRRLLTYDTRRIEQDVKPVYLQISEEARHEHRDNLLA